MVFIGGGGAGFDPAALGPLALLGLAVAIAFLVVMLLRAAGEALLGAVRRARLRRGAGQRGRGA